MPTQSARTWRDNAAEFAALTKQGIDVRLAVLVACSVKRRAGQGRRLPREHVEVQKVSGAEFARVAGMTSRVGNATGGERVLRHLDAWLATQGLPDPDTLEPGDVNRVEVDEETAERFVAEFHRLTGDRPTGGRPRDARPEDAAVIITRDPDAVIEALDDRQFERLVDAVSESHERRRASNRRPLPPAPFGGDVPEAYPGASDDAGRMDVQRDVARLAAAIDLLGVHVREGRGHQIDRDRLQREADRLATLIIEVGEAVAEVAR